MSTLGDMFDFRSVFEEERNKLPQKGLVLVFNTERAYPGNDRFAFVEGSDDFYVYRHSSNQQFKGRVRFIYGKRGSDDSGKEGVIAALHDISSNKTLSDEIGRCVFVVDRDWDCLVTGKWEEGLFITEGHSLESFFLMEQHVKLIFKELELSDEAFREFYEAYLQFCKETALYWSLKATVIYGGKTAQKDGKVFRVPVEKKPDLLFLFKMEDGKVVYDAKAVDRENELMLNAIKDKKNLEHYQAKMQKLIEEDPNLIRGHQAFNYLECYLKGKYGIAFNLRSMSTKLIRDCKIKLIETGE